MSKIKKKFKGLKRFIKKYKHFILLLAIIILWILIPPFINLMFNTNAIFLPDFFGYVNKDNKDAWISFYGAIIGGMITLLGVAWTIVDQNKKREQDLKEATKPILVANGCTYEKIKDCGTDRVYECILEYKNVGKGILYNPRVFNIEYTIDKKKIGKLNTSFTIKNYLDIGDTIDNDIMITLDSVIRNSIYKSLKGRGNTVSLQIIMYVGGKDMYGLDVITKLDFKSSLVFFPGDNIQIPLHGGGVVSTVLFDEEEIYNILNHADMRYNIRR